MREVAWVKAARKEFLTFPQAVQTRMKDALAIAAFGQKADIVKPLKGFESGVFEIALPYRKDAYRAVYAVQLGDAIWVLHAFQKKSTQGIKTQRRDIEVVRARLKQLRETGA